MCIRDRSEDLTPGMQTYGLLYCTNEVNSVTTIENAKNYLDEKGLRYVEQIVTNSSEVQQAAQALVGNVDAIFVPNDSVIQAAMPLVAEVARDAKIPVYGSSAVMVNSGAFATVAITDTEIGMISADMAIAHFEGDVYKRQDEFIRGAKEAGHSVYRFDTAHECVHPCIGCDACGCRCV